MSWIMGVFDTSDGKFRVSADGQLAGSRQCSGVFEGQALSINQEGPIRILPCVVKKGNSKGLQRELSVLRRCRESGLPLRSGREEYFLGECIDSTPDEDSASSCCRYCLKSSISSSCKNRKAETNTTLGCRRMIPLLLVLIFFDFPF